jgi:hypothetical protein
MQAGSSHNDNCFEANARTAATVTPHMCVACMQPFHWLSTQFNTNVSWGLREFLLLCRWWQYGSPQLGRSNIQDKQGS